MSGDGPVEFGCLDWDRDIEVRRRLLPHWYQEGTAVFVTFRTLDSIPAEVLLRLRGELTEWLRSCGLPQPLLDGYQAGAPEIMQKIAPLLSESELTRFLQLTRTLHNRALDDCHGECLLKNTAVARILHDIMLYDHDRKYNLDSFVIMPNHVHALLQFRPSYDLKVISFSWMRYSARLINQMLGRHGAFWKPEVFDSLIRTAEHFRSVHDYIQNNPRSAGLSEGEFTYWSAE